MGAAIAVVLLVIAGIGWILNREDLIGKKYTGGTDSIAQGEADTAAYENAVGVDDGTGAPGGVDATLESTGENNLEYLQEKTA